MGTACLLAALLAGLGCGPSDRALSSDVTYEPPMEHSIVVETVVNLPFDAAWSELIRRLADSAFQISTLEKESRFVRVDLERSTDLAAEANRPSRYVDCGRTTRVFREGAESRETRFDYDVATSSTYTEVDERDGGYRVSEVERRVGLDASGTIYLQPEGPRKTRVTVKARYHVEIQIEGTATPTPRAPDETAGPAQSFGPRIEAIRFTTFQPGTDDRSGGLTCRATGAFEHALVALANPAAAI